MQAARSLTDERLRAPAAPVRRDILSLVARDEAPTGRIAARIRISRPAVSRHLRVLREARPVTVREDGASRHNQSDREALTELGRWFEKFWDDGLPRLKALAEHEPREDA